jgi:hypothetical protein
MGDAFRMGGWGMYPTAIAGLVLIVCALRYAAGPDAGKALVVRRLQLLTFMVGCLGFCMGCIKSFTAKTPEVTADFGAALAGVGESLNCIALALVTMVIAGIASTVGASRIGKNGGGELTDPHV